MGIYTTGGRDVRGGISVGGDLRIPLPEQNRTVYCDQAHYGHVSDRGAEAGVKGDQAVVGAGRNVCGGDADGGLVGRTYGGGEVYGRDGDGDLLRQASIKSENQLMVLSDSI